jgi:hypothetical protein
VRDDDDISEDEWRIIEERAARRDLASDEEVEGAIQPLPQRMKLRFERGALADLDEIFAYVAKDKPGAAAQLVARIEQGKANELSSLLGYC